MDMKRLAVGTVVGGITMFVVGYLIFELGFGAYYAANVGAATNVFRESTLAWASALGGLAFGALLTYVLLDSSGPLTIASGFIKGAIVGFLAWVSVDLVYYGATNVWTFTMVIVDPLLELVHSGIGGAVIAAALARVPASAAIRAAE
jgi:hypothetical protein